MTHVRKSLALLLAIVMIFSSMSVAASAVEPKVSGGTAVNFDVKFFRKDGSNWIETERAMPGEKVKMRVYLTTDYTADSSNIYTMFDSDLLVPTFPDGINRVGTHPDDNFFYNYARQYDYRWEKNEANLDVAGSWVNTLPDGFFTGKDLISSQIIAYSAAMLTGSTNDDWALEFPMQVVNGTAANTVGYIGEAVVPGELVLSPEKQHMPINVPRGKTADDGMWAWYANVTTLPGTLTTTSNFILDANDGSFDDKGTTQSKVSGIIGTQLTGFGTEQPTKSGYTFKGWTAVPVDKDHKVTAEVAEELGIAMPAEDTYLTEDQFNELLITTDDYSDYAYKYEDQTVYAAWSKASETKVSYDYEIYMLNVGGDKNNVADYTLTSTIPGEAELGETVTKDVLDFIPGFSFNEALSDKSLTVNKESLKLKHYYARNEYTITYHYEDASEMPQTETFSVQYGASVPTCNANPGKPGYSFKGWSLNSDNTLRAIPEVMPANNLDAYMVTEEDLYSYVFIAESEDGVKGTFSDGTSIKSYDLKYGQALSETVPAPAAKGYSFTGWDKAIPAAATGDMTFRATYLIEAYEYKFVCNGEVIKNDFVYYNDVLTTDDIPAGYATEGWSADGGATLVNFPYTVTGDVTFVATEKASYLDAIFMADGKEFTRIPVKVGEVIPAPEDKPTKYGYDFIDWNPNVGGDDGAIMDTDGASFDAIFEPKTTTITFVDENGKEVLPSITQKFDTDVTAPTAIPEREGYEFLRWDTAIPEKMPAEDTAITAIFVKKTYKVEYKDTDGSLIASENYKFGDEIEVIDNPSKEGYEFGGWTWSETPVDNKMPAKDLVATANWTAKEYKITFSSAEGTEPAEIPAIEAAFGTAITAPTVTLKNNVFKGWALADDETKTIITFPKTMPAENMDLVAVWETEKADVIFNAGKGEFDDGDNIEIVPDVPVGSDINDYLPTPDPVRLGFLFGGWELANNGQYNAIWNPDPNYADESYIINIVYINPVTGEELPFKSVTGTARNGQTVEIVADGEESTADIVYTFEELAPSQNHVVNEEKTTVTTLEVVAGERNELTVYYKPAQLKAEFLANGGAFADGSDKAIVTGAYGDDVVAPADPTRLGYEFAGWDSNVMSTFTSDATYTAKWTKAINDAIFNVLNEEGKVIDTITVPYEYGAEVSAPTYDKVGAGQTFSGWVVPEGTTMGAKDMTFNATLEDIIYTITYIFKGAVPADAVLPAPQKTILNGEVTVATPEDVDGYAFNGWKISSMLPVETGTIEPGSTFKLIMPTSVVLEGSWEKIPVAPTYKELSYVYEGDIPENVPELPEAAEVEVGTQVKLADVPSVDGYTFAGWYKDGVLTESFLMPDADVEIKGVWTKNEVPPVPGEFKVTYKYTGNVPENADELPAEATATEGTTVTTADLPADVDGYTFAGWYVNGKLTESFVMPSEDVEIEGRWTKNPVPGEYKITYIYTGDVPADAEELPAESSAATGTTVVTANIPAEVDGYTFSGWYVNGKLAESFVVGEEDITVEGKWTKNDVPEEFNVSYHYTGDVPVNAPALPADEKVAEGKTYNVADLPDAVVGYDFAGWYVDGKLTSSFVMPSEDVEIEGRWTKNDEYAVTYKYVGNDVGLEIPANAPAVPVDENGYLAGEKVTVADKPELEGYKFHGWYYNGVRYDGELASEFTMPNHNVTLIGMWTKDVPGAYDVSYTYLGEAPENAPELPAIEKVAIGETVKVADVPKLDGYTFDGWYVDNEIVTEFVMPDHDVTIIGVWNEIPVEEYGVTYKYEGEVPAGAPSAPVDTNEYEEGEAVTVKALPVLEGYEFDGWYYNNTKYSAGETTSMVEGGIEFTGKWVEVIPETYTVTYEYTGTVPEGAPALPVDANAYKEGDNVTVAVVPALDGYTFSGWYYNSVITTSFEMPANDVTITGEWIEVTPDSYAITYTYTGTVPADAPTLPAASSAEVGAEVTVASAPSMDGYTFDGWYYDGVKYDGETNTKFTMPAENVTLTGSWTAIEYDLIIDANGGQFADGTQQYTDSLPAGADLNAPADPTKTGFDLIGWTDNNGNSYEMLPEKMPAGDTTFTAVWKEQETPKHTITYYLVEGGNVYAIGTYAEGETMTHPVVGEYEGIIYDGWVDKNGNPIQSVMGTTDLVAYAVPVGVKEYKATFVVDGTVIQQKNVKVGTVIDVPADPTKEGYLFSGWYPTVPEYMPAEDVTFTATFVKEPVEYKEYSARYVVDDKTYALYVLEEGDVIPVPEDPKKFGFKFVGWEPEVPATMPGENLEFVAQWEIDETVVTVIIGGTVIAGGVIAGIAGANAAWITGVSIIGGILVIVGTAALIKHTHTVTYLVDGEVYKTYKVIEGTKIPVPADPVKEGAEFKGWEPEVPDRMGNTDLVFEATWADVAADDDSDVDVEIPATGSAAGIAAFAVISGAAAAAYVITRKKKED